MLVQILFMVSGNYINATPRYHNISSNSSMLHGNRLPHWVLLGVSTHILIFVVGLKSGIGRPVQGYCRNFLKCMKNMVKLSYIIKQVQGSC